VAFQSEGERHVEDAQLVVEVADTTLAFDLGTKAALYGRGGIAELWVVDVQDRSVRVFREPSASGYRASFTVAAGQSVSCLALPAVTLAPAGFVSCPLKLEVGRAYRHPPPQRCLKSSGVSECRASNL
jgi:Uma2 family endonuclease